MNMKVVLYSTIHFTDSDFPLVKGLQNHNVKVLFFINNTDDNKTGGFLDLREDNIPLGISKADSYKAFQLYRDYFDISNIYIVNRERKSFSIRNVIIYLSLIWKIIKFNPNIVHTMCILGLVESMLYIFKQKMLLTVHDPFMHSGEYQKSSENKRRFAFKMIKNFILLNKSQKKDFIDYYKLQNKSIFISQIGICDCLNYLAKDNKESSTDYILQFGHVSPYKGIDVLCEAMELVHKKNPKIKCIIAGNGPYYFDKSIYENKGYITFINRYITTKELATLINNARFTICPYRDATQSGVVFSSFALGKPVIATNVGSLGETVKDGITGVLVETCDSKCIAKAILDLYDSESTIDSMSKNILNIYHNGKNSRLNIANNTINIYNTIKNNIRCK